MKFYGLNNGCAFSRNPIRFRAAWPEGAWDSDGGKFNVQINAHNIYEGRFTDPLDVDISEIADALIPYLPDPPLNPESPLTIIENKAGIESRTLTLYAEYDKIGISSEPLIVFRGGIPQHKFRKYVTEGLDGFPARLADYRSNFFFSVRTEGRFLNIKETELYPLYFFNPDEQCEFFAIDMQSGAFFDLETIYNAVYTLDIQALRHAFVKKHGILPSVIDFYRDREFSCRVAVTEAQASKDRCRIRFRNSLGVFEIIDLEDMCSFSIGGNEGNESYMSFDDAGYSYLELKDRGTPKVTVSVSTGFKRQDEFPLVAEVMASEEVYLLDVAPEPIRVIPDFETLEIPQRQEKPESVTLKFKLSEPDADILRIIMGKPYDSTRIFSPEHNDIFN